MEEVKPKFKVGDKYVHFTKHGGVNKGVVADVFSNQTVVDVPNRIRYRKWFIRTGNGITLCLNEERIYLVEKEFSEADCENILMNAKELAKRKSERTS